MITIAQRIITRTLRPGEPLPESLGSNFNHLPRLDPDWIWVVETDEIIQGCLIASPAHGLAILLRLCAIPGAPWTVTVRLLRGFLRDMVSRGYVGYVTCLDPDLPMEKKLIEVVAKSGGQMFGKGIICGDLTDRRSSGRVS